LVTITSTDNPRVKAIAKLKSARERRRTGLFLVEGRRELQRAASAGIAIETVVVCDDLLGDDVTPDVAGEVLHVGTAPMRRMAIRENPPGVIGIAKQFDTTLGHLALSANPLLLVAESIEKPGNLGAMMRTCDAVGAALVVADPGTDLFNPNVVRASQGALFTVPVATDATSPVIDWLGAHDVTVIGGYPDATQNMWEADMSGPTAILVGAEDVGVSAQWDDIATPVRIPMAGSVDSLNVSVSAAVLLYEAMRQRR
jgi:RNA methyltransferase, TrmH family